jgi:hypothetical protein
MGDAVPGHEIEGPLGVEAVSAGHHGLAVLPRGQHRVEPPPHPGPVGRGPEHRVGIIELQVVTERERRQIRVHDAMAVEQPLGQARRARGVHEQRRIFTAGAHGFERRLVAPEASIECPLVAARATRHDAMLKRGVAIPRVAMGRPHRRLRNDGPRARVVEAVRDGVGPVELRQRHDHGAELVNREVGDGGLRARARVHGHRLSRPDTQLTQTARQSIREHVQLREGKSLQGAAVFLEDQRRVPGSRTAREATHGIHGDVGALRDADPQPLAPLVVVKVRLPGERVVDVLLHGVPLVINRLEACTLRRVHRVLRRRGEAHP